MRIRFITDLPPVIDKERPGSFADTAFASNSSGRMRAEVPRWHRAGGPDRRELPAISGGAGAVSSVPSHGASPCPIRAWRAPLPQACGPAAADSRARKVARHRQVRAVALDQAADDARGIKHALDTDRRGQPGSARPCSVTLGIVPSLEPLGPHGPGPGPANGPVLRLRPGSPAALVSPCRCCFRHEHAYGTR